MVRAAPPSRTRVGRGRSAVRTSTAPTCAMRARDECVMRVRDECMTSALPSAHADMHVRTRTRTRNMHTQHAKHGSGADQVSTVCGIHESALVGRSTWRACASAAVAYSPSSDATLPTISLTTKSTFSGRVTSVEKPSMTSTTSAQPAARTAARARAAASELTSTAYTLRAPASAASSASTACGPVPMSRTDSVPLGASPRRAAMALA